MVCVSVTETVGTLTFGIYSLLISNSIVNRLLLSTPQTKLLSEGLFVETIVLGSILLLLSITMLLLNRSLYERQEV